MRAVRIGAGAGYSGDRIEPARELAERGDLDYLVFECLAERTIALAQQMKIKNPEAGYDPLLEQRMMAVLRICNERGVRIITNMGAANPVMAAKAVAGMARNLGLSGLKVAAVAGDDVLGLLDCDSSLLEREGTVASLGDTVISANAYLGIDGIVEALRAGAQVIVTGRVSDPALFVAPLAHHFNWAHDDWARLGQATVVGHLLECAGQVTGGYFADPGYKDVHDLARLGFPIAEVREDGTAVITKVEGSGGCVTLQTCREQLLYEILDPARYVQPDVVADFTRVKLVEDGRDRISVSGGTGTARPDRLKVSIGYSDGYVGEGQMTYIGPGAVQRGRLALDIVAERMKITGLQALETRFELIGVNSGYGPSGRILEGTGWNEADPAEVRIRVAARTRTMSEAVAVGNEVETLYTNGPAGGGGAAKSAREVVAIVSTLMPRGSVRPSVSYEVA